MTRDEYYRETARLAAGFALKFLQIPKEKLKEISEEAGLIWLEADINSYLTKAEDLDAAYEEVEEFLKTSSAYDMEMSEMLETARKRAAIRRDFAAALRKVREGSDLSGKLSYAFSNSDIRNLMELHRKNRFRKKIEDLLDCCNFHFEAGAFRAGRYDEVEKTLNEN